MICSAPVVRYRPVGIVNAKIGGRSNPVDERYFFEKFFLIYIEQYIMITLAKADRAESAIEV
jgi:hypothetical protein